MWRFLWYIILMKMCSVNGCGRPSRSLGMCSTHYYRQYAGTPIDAPMNGRGRQPKVNLTGDQLHHDYHVLNMTESEIGRKYGYTQSGIHVALVRFGIGRRTKAARDQSGERNPAWAGNDVGYFGAHKRVRKLRGTPESCDKCGKTGPGRYEWASISGNYTDPNDYFRLCKRCHNIHDGIADNLRC